MPPHLLKQMYIYIHQQEQFQQNRIPLLLVKQLWKCFDTVCHNYVDYNQAQCLDLLDLRISSLDRIYNVEGYRLSIDTWNFLQFVDSREKNHHRGSLHLYHCQDIYEFRLCIERLRLRVYKSVFIELLWVLLSYLSKPHKDINGDNNHFLDLPIKSA